MEKKPKKPSKTIHKSLKNIWLVCEPGKYLFSIACGKPLRGQSKQARSDSGGIANDFK